MELEQIRKSIQKEANNMMSHKDLFHKANAKMKANKN